MRTSEALSSEVKSELARLTDTQPDDWFLVFRARYGMEVVLKTLYEKRGGGEVITQPLTCATAVNPILSAGHTPTYIDTSYEDFSLNTAQLAASGEARALIMQHSFSIECDMQGARKFADAHKLLLIEDSAHHIGMLASGSKKPLADISIHSFGVEKMLPTKFGGAVWVNPDMKDTELRDAVRSRLENLPPISRRQSCQARRYKHCNRLLNHMPSSIEPAFRSFLTSTGLFQPAIMPDELEGKNHDAPAAPNSFILRGMLEGLQAYKSIYAKRAKVAALYADQLSGIVTLAKNMPDDYAPARFPLLCNDEAEAEQLFTALRSAGHYSGKWYRPTLFPGVPDQKKYNYDRELYPIAEDISARILNLPTLVTEAEAKEIVDVVRRETN